MKNKLIPLFSSVVLFLVFSSSSIAQPPPCDVYVTNTQNCDVDIKFYLYAFSSGNTDCDGNLTCGTIIYNTGWITISANATNHKAVDGRTVPYSGGWGRATAVDPGGSGSERWDDDGTNCGTGASNPFHCTGMGQPTFGVVLDRTTTGVSALLQ